MGTDQEPVRDAESPLLSKLRQQQMLNEKQELDFIAYWLCSHCQTNVKHACQMAQSWWMRKWILGRDGILHPLQNRLHIC